MIWILVFQCPLSAYRLLCVLILLGIGVRSRIVCLDLVFVLGSSGVIVTVMDDRLAVGLALGPFLVLVTHHSGILECILNRIQDGNHSSQKQPVVADKVAEMSLVAADLA